MERHRIQEVFSEEMIDKIREICNDPENTDNDMKGDKILFYLKDKGFVEIGSGTNRIAVRHMDYIYKIALDSYGFRDNWNEFKMSKELQPYVTKTYECNGYIAVAEYVNLITKQEFIDSREQIKAILEILADDYLFCDMSLDTKNAMNFGYVNDGSLVILDYGYIYPIDRKIMYCKICGGKLKWNSNFSMLRCPNCGREHDPIEIRDRMWKKEESFKDRSDYDKASNKDGIIEVSFTM
jgi:hypothetical protein